MWPKAPNGRRGERGEVEKGGGRGLWGPNGGVALITTCDLTCYVRSQMGKTKGNTRPDQGATMAC
eukprot:61669-Pyramimonas_sp.AAC.1